MSAIQQAIYSYAVASGGGSFATWDPANKAATVSLSNGNLTANCGTAGSASVYSTTGKSIGKWYWEVTATTATAGPLVGISQLGATSIWPGVNATSWGYDVPGGIYFNNGNTGSVAAYTSGDVLGFALDVSSGSQTLAFYKNNVLQVTKSISSSTWYPIVGQSGTSTNSFTANFGASAFTYSPPAGYYSGLPTTSLTYATWNPSDKGANITLSGGNLSATSNGASGASVRSTISKSSGKWYWEFAVAQATDEVGIANGSASMTAYAGNDANSWTYFGGASPGIYNNGTRIFTCAAFTTGDIIGVALDVGAGTCAFYKNNTLQATVPSLAATSYYGLWSCSPAGGGVTPVNFGASAFTYAPPSGYNAGLYA